MTVYVLGTKYSIKNNPTLESDGSFDCCNQLIELHSELENYPTRKQRVLWHELAHAFCHESGLDETLSEDAQEMFCQSLSAFIIQLTGGNMAGIDDERTKTI